MVKGDEIILSITKEQFEYTKEIVEFSVEHHKVQDRFNSAFQYPYRIIGSMGEVVFADCYGLPRPVRSFGAIDGQDYGIDFNLGGYNINVKTMHRKKLYIDPDAVLNIPKPDVEREDITTDYFYCLSFIANSDSKFKTKEDCVWSPDWQMALIGHCKRTDVLEGKIGTFFENGTERIRKDGSKFKFHDDTYEIKFSEMGKINKSKIKSIVK